MLLDLSIHHRIYVQKGGLGRPPKLRGFIHAVSCLTQLDSSSACNTVPSDISTMHFQITDLALSEPLISIQCKHLLALVCLIGVDSSNVAPNVLGHHLLFAVRTSASSPNGLRLIVALLTLNRALSFSWVC